MSIIEEGRRIISRLLSIIKPVQFDTISYWKKRSEMYGKRAVLNLAHDDSQIEEVTLYQKKILFPVVKNFLNGNEAKVLDFGCGPGRFTPGLANLIGGKAFGIDPIKSFIRMAAHEDAVNEYKVIKKHRIPYPDQTFDVIWISLVLGGIQDSFLPRVLAEIRRVSKANTLLILVENSVKKDYNLHWYYRGITFYQELFKDFSLNLEKEYMDMDEPISVLVGRRSL